MSMRIFKCLSLTLLPLLLLFVTTAPAWAGDPVTLELQAPKQVSLGKEITVTAVLKDSKGAPIPGATIILWTPASFLSTSSAIELGKAITDAQGKVAFPYQPRSQKSATLNASFTGNSRYDPAQASAELVIQGSTQLYQQTAGVKLPVLGVWLLAAILGGVWSTYFAVMVILTLIAREGSRRSDSLGGSRG